MATRTKAEPAKTTSVFLRRPADPETETRLEHIKMLARARGLTLWAYLDRLVTLHENLLDQDRAGGRLARTVLDGAGLRRVDA